MCSGDVDSTSNIVTIATELRPARHNEQPTIRSQHVLNRAFQLERASHLGRLVGRRQIKHDQSVLWLAYNRRPALKMDLNVGNGVFPSSALVGADHMRPRSAAPAAVAQRPSVNHRHFVLRRQALARAHFEYSARCIETGRRRQPVACRHRWSCFLPPGSAAGDRTFDHSPPALHGRKARGACRPIPWDIRVARAPKKQMILREGAIDMRCHRLVPNAADPSPDPMAASRIPSEGQIPAVQLSTPSASTGPLLIGQRETTRS